MPIPSFLVLTSLLLLVSAPPGGQAAASSPVVDPVLWPEAQRSFLQDGPGLLLSAEQRSELRSLDEAGRGRFIQAFLDKDPLPETPANELREAIARRSRLADSLIPWPSDVRWQIVFLNGPPADRLMVDCGQAFRPIEVWTYRRGIDAATGKVDERGVVVFRPGPGEPYRQWLPLDSKRALYTSEMEYWLEQWEELRGYISAERFDLQVCREAAEKIDKSTGVPGLTGARRRGVRPTDNSSFLAAPRDLARWAREAAAAEAPQPPKPLTVQSFELRFPERDGQQRMRTRALVEVATRGLETSEDNGKPSYNLTVQGVVEQEGKPFEELRVRYRLPVPQGDEALVLAVDRSLRTDKPFLLRLLIKDDASGAEARVSRAFLVPSEATPDPVAANASVGVLVPETAKRGNDSLVLMPPPADVVLGLWRAEALVSGDRIKKVVFMVDGTAQLTRANAPFSAELRLARYPTEQTVRAEGYDEKGELVAADEVIINQPRGALGVWIVEPPKGRRINSGTVHARAELMVPDGRRVQTLEFKVNDATVAKLEKPPWRADIQVPAGDLAYITVTATLDDGTRAEAVRFIKSPQFVEEIDVNLIELFVAVTDKSGDYVRDLQQDDFEILESGKKQEIAKFELVENLPLTVGILLDTSGSMAQSLGTAERAAADFLHRVIKPKDKAFAVSFAGRPRLDMPPTDDAEAVARSIGELQAVGDTALHDALIQSLYYFRGMTGQRALVLLSDGDDNASYFSYKDALEYAQRSGVAIYTIGFDLPGFTGGIRGKLGELSETTGGRLFLTSNAEDLPAIYAQIERELRSRYLVAYNSDQKGPQAGYRQVEVRVKKAGLKARTVRGTYQ